MAIWEVRAALWLVRLLRRLVSFRSSFSTARPRVANRAVKQSKKPVYQQLVVKSSASGSYDDFDAALDERSQIILIFGRRGSGKSALGFRLLENVCSKGRPGFVLGVKRSLLPSWLSEVTSIDQAKHGGIVLVDEGAVAFGSRESMKSANIALGKMLAVARHLDLTVLFITQNTGMIDKAVLNLADVLIVKEGSLLQSQMERTVVRTFVEKADSAIKPYNKDERVKYFYVFSDDFEGLCAAGLPSFWNAKISKSRG